MTRQADVLIKLEAIASLLTFKYQIRCESKGWTVTFIERKSRYLVTAEAGLKNTELFAKTTASAWEWSKPSQFIRWFTDGERRYAQQL